MNQPMLLIKHNQQGCFVMARFPRDMMDSVLNIAQQLWDDHTTFKIIEDRDVRSVAGKT